VSRHYCRDLLEVCAADRQDGYLDGAACFWHMVDLLWIVLFALLYLVHRS
jgi:heme/copper-type cytochrome/quinol oxidase subunit 3